MAKKFKNFRKNDHYDDDEWGDVNEDRLKEKELAKKNKQRKQEVRERKHIAFKDFRDN